MESMTARERFVCWGQPSVRPRLDVTKKSTRKRNEELNVPSPFSMSSTVAFVLILAALERSTPRCRDF
ncbi:hypothetical protein BDR05DRAFT_962687 [Suillus weaverae]|nr:hypothetical protein BDR05DRAFT_962687 [Suillus weaverae]